VKYVPAVLVPAIGVAAIVAGRAGDAPGVLLLGVVLIIGTVAVYAERSRPFLAIGIGVMGIAAGLADDAPGVVLLGLVLICGTLVVSAYRARRA